MPRANRIYRPNHIWHITHRCHNKAFLLKFARDRQRWRYWLFEAKKRYRLCVLNYIVTCNHVHLLVRDRGQGEIARSMQLIAGRTAQEFNQRKARRGAFWEDRYHATAVDAQAYFARCMVYIDLNMVRAGVVNHPREWPTSGYREIQRPPGRYAVIDVPVLLNLFSVRDLEQLQQICRAGIAESLRVGQCTRDSIWSESLAVGRPAFVEAFQAELGIQARHRGVVETENAHVLREPAMTYESQFSAKTGCLSGNFTVSWALIDLGPDSCVGSTLGEPAVGPLATWFLHRLPSANHT